MNPIVSLHNLVEVTQQDIEARIGLMEFLEKIIFLFITGSNLNFTHQIFLALCHK